MLASLLVAGIVDAQDVVFAFDSSPASGPPGTEIQVSGSKCGAVIGSIEGIVTVVVVSEDGGVEIGAGRFDTFNTNWQGTVQTSADAAPGRYLVEAHCSTYAEVDYPPNTFVVTGGGRSESSSAPIPAPTAPFSSPASTGPNASAVQATPSSGASAPVGLFLLSVVALAIAALVAWRIRSRRPS